MRTLTERDGDELGEKNAIKEAVNEKLRALFESYKGSTKNLRVIKPRKKLLQATWNLSHIFTVTADDPVYVHPDQGDVCEKYIKVIYHRNRFVHILSKSDFNL